MFVPGGGDALGNWIHIGDWFYCHGYHGLLAPQFKAKAAIADQVRCDTFLLLLLLLHVVAVYFCDRRNFRMISQIAFFFPLLVCFRRRRFRRFKA